MKKLEGFFFFPSLAHGDSKKGKSRYRRERGRESERERRKERMKFK